MLRKLLWKIKKKLNSNTMNIVVSDGENASYQDQNM